MMVFFPDLAPSFDASRALTAPTVLTWRYHNVPSKFRHVPLSIKRQLGFIILSVLVHVHYNYLHSHGILSFSFNVISIVTNVCKRSID